MATHSLNHPIKDHTPSKTPSLGQETKKIHRVNFDQPEPERFSWQTSDEFIKNKGSLSSKRNKEEEGEEIASTGPTCVEETGRERLKRHRAEMAGRVCIPDVWGQEDLLKDWIDCSVFDSSFGNNTMVSARRALVEQGRTPTPTAAILPIENRC